MVCCITEQWTFVSSFVSSLWGFEPNTLEPVMLAGGLWDSRYRVAKLGWIPVW